MFNLQPHASYLNYSIVGLTENPGSVQVHLFQQFSANFTLLSFAASSSSL